MLQMTATKKPTIFDMFCGFCDEFTPADKTGEIRNGWTIYHQDDFHVAINRDQYCMTIGYGEDDSPDSMIVLQYSADHSPVITHDTFPPSIMPRVYNAMLRAMRYA